MITRPKSASAVKARGVLIVKILNKCILSILVYNLFLDWQRNSSIHRFIGSLHEIEIKFDWAKKKVRHSEMLCHQKYTNVQFHEVNKCTQNSWYSEILKWRYPSLTCSYVWWQMIYAHCWLTSPSGNTLLPWVNYQSTKITKLII